MATYSGTPKTWTAGETLLASDFNAEIRDPLAALAGASTAYTPTISGFTLGNGTVTGKYLRVGKLVAFTAQFTFGSSSAAAAAPCGFTLPVTSAANNPWAQWATFTDTGGTTYQAQPFISTLCTVYGIAAATSAIQSPSTTYPFTWATGDIVRCGGIYEAA